MAESPATEQLPVGDVVLHADQSDSEIIAALSTLSWTWAPLTGLSGGELGWLARDIRAGRTTIPGRTHYRSSEMVYTAFRTAREDHHEMVAEFARDNRKLWWSRYGFVFAVGVILAGAFAALTFFPDEILRVLAPEGRSAVDESILFLATLDQLAESLLPILAPASLIVLVVAMIVLLAASALRR